MRVDVDLEELERDPYAIFTRLRGMAPLVFVEPLNMWYATSYETVRAILSDNVRFTTSWPRSRVFSVFGQTMLTHDGAEHARMRQPFLPMFGVKAIEGDLNPLIKTIAGSLVADLEPCGAAELRKDFAARLPILVMLSMFGMPQRDEPLLRSWYDAFEAALSNYTGKPDVDARAALCLEEFKVRMRQALNGEDAAQAAPASVAALAKPDEMALNADETLANLALVFFGGISTVEALILNALWALGQNPEILARVRRNPNLLPHLVDETMRWRSPVQSALRHLTADAELGGQFLRAGDTVNCMLGAANRDPKQFKDPDRFDITRENARTHLGFAFGPHMCLGFRLAKVEGEIALRALIETLPDIEIDIEASAPPTGYEFHQPRALVARWRQN